MKEILVTRSSMPTLEEYIEEIKPLWQTHWLSNNGAIHQKFEKKVQDYLKTDNLTLFTNGHLALCAAIKGLGLTGEVITTPFTFISTSNAILQNGLTPVFCDINPTDCNIDVTKIEALITKKTSAIIPVHVYGNPCNIEQIQKIATKHNLKVIYDAAHAFGMEIGGRGIGSFGDVSMFSFHSTKVFHSIEGGALTYKNPDYKNMFNNLKNFGIISQEEAIEIGTNAKMNEFQAAMGVCNLKNIDENIAKRKTIKQRYQELLKNTKGISFVLPNGNIKCNYAYVPILVDETLAGFTRDDVAEALSKENIFARKYFYPLITDYACYKNRFNSALTPIAKKTAKRILTLPIFSDMLLQEVDFICNIINSLNKEDIK